MFIFRFKIASDLLLYYRFVYKKHLARKTKENTFKISKVRYIDSKIDVCIYNMFVYRFRCILVLIN